VTGVLRGDLDGRGLRGEDAPDGLRCHLARPEVQEGILQELRHEWSGARPFVWWQAIQDCTRVEINPDAVRGRGDFAAELLAICDRLECDPGAIAELIEVQSEPLRRVLASPLVRDAELHADPVTLLAAARTLALNLLESDELK